MTNWITRFLQHQRVTLAEPLKSPACCVDGGMPFTDESEYATDKTDGTFDKVSFVSFVSVESPRLTTRLSRYEEMISTASTLAELSSILEEFSTDYWSLGERSTFSNLYTPVAIQLIHDRGEERWHVLEELAALCWNGAAQSS
jgi:hypothetical protein